MFGENILGKGDLLAAFEEKLRLGLSKCGLSLDDVGRKSPLGLAVSGGADSLSLLRGLVSLLGTDVLRVITVNHNIREESESAGDAQFVVKVCSLFGLPCKVVTIPRGKVFDEAKKRGHGIEDAARSLRYQAFSAFCEEEKLCALCLAHNQNDLLETLLMRFLQGSGTEGGGGIARRRGLFLRPLLDVDRKEIEAYLRGLGQEWRTDATNSDTAYLRNNVRKNLMPFLDTHFKGWKTALQNGGEKARADNEALQELAESLSWERGENEFFMTAADFYAQSPAVRRRLLYRACDMLSADGRIPFSLVRAVIAWQNDDSDKKDTQALSARGLEISLKSGKIYVKKCQNKATECGFLDIIEEDSGSVLLRRSLQSGDVVRTKDGKFKSVQKIFSDWKVSAEDKNRIPLIQNLSQEGQPILAILGSELGYSDWIVK